MDGDHLKLPHLSVSYVRLWGRFLRVTQPSATVLHSSLYLGVTNSKLTTCVDRLRFRSFETQ